MQRALASEPTPLEARRQRLILLTLAGVQFTSIVDFMVVMPLGPQLMRVMEIDPGQFAMVVASYTYAAGVSGLVASSLVDRFGRKAAFLWLYTGFLVGTLLCGLASSYALLVAARVATGAFGGILGGMAMAIIGDVFPEERRGRATGALMSAFALASVAGVPFGLYLGTQFGWHVPFVLLSALGCPMLGIAAITLPPLRDHVSDAPVMHPLRSLAETFAVPNHLNAFVLIAALMIGGFAVSPLMSAFLVSNVGITEDELPWVFVVAGGSTLFTAPLVGRLADRYGKLRMFRILAPASAAIMLAVTCLPSGYRLLAVVTTAALMVVNSGRMIPAMAMVTSSVTSDRRGGFLSANSSVQHLAAGLGASLGGLLITESADGQLQGFPTVGLVAAVVTLACVWLAGRLRLADESGAVSVAQSLAAAAEASVDVGEPLVSAE
jgi:DHA1 family inner membrane transport protein